MNETKISLRTKYFQTTKSLELSQTRRRELFLKTQEERRTDQFEKLRESIVGKILKENNETKLNKNKKKVSKTAKKYANQLILPEILEEVPSKMLTEYFAVPYPKQSKRCLVIANRGHTISRNLDGTMIEDFQSALPGGSFSNRLSRNPKIYCVLDCLRVESVIGKKQNNSNYMNKDLTNFENEKQDEEQEETEKETKEITYYVLDLMSWNGVNYFKATAEFRFFWLEVKLQEEGEGITKVSKKNTYPFVALPHKHLSIKNLNDIKNNNSDECEGILFYHYQCLYLPDNNPLVCYILFDEIQELIDNIEKL
ncbi:snurportin1 rnut1 protein RNA u transporter [Anaeramoeba flamelloides]|uniref:Snurportin-1 n=1 Tax=Anaeramoeba flamelloides TaxID=1746091 RepID=A0AAV7YGZ6_9EUKA|nr:snurportin1 rnut1 protein RNA u transporter [Anaeramoeba flamelloides]